MRTPARGVWPAIAVAIGLTGCSASAADVDVASLIEPICPEGSTVQEPADGRPVSVDMDPQRAYAVCRGELGHSDVIVEAYIVRSDPDRELLAAADGWQSGDGTGVTWALDKRGGDWVAVVAVGHDFDHDAFEALAEQGFELHANPSSPLEGYDDHYGG